jgi:hypothetical protein
MKSRAPFDKVQAIQSSLRCFACGIIGLLPGIGLPFAIVALGEYFRVMRNQARVWNPAEGYAGTGGICATVGLLLTLVLAGVIYIEAS